MRVHVTGSSGFLGAELLATEPKATGDRVEVRDAAAVLALFERLRPTVVVHTAYRQHGPDAADIIVDGSENVARAAQAIGARLLHISTDVVFDGRAGRAYTEADEPNPCSAYGAAKAGAEAAVLEAHPGALVVRTSLILGGPGHAPSPHELVASDPEAVHFSDEIRSPIQVGDLAAALHELAGMELAGKLNVAGADDLSRAELSELIAGHPVRRAKAPASRPLDCRLDSTLARRRLRTPLRGAREVWSTRC
jgi:dTDP-4-dehydrorhamnose reductase